MAAKDSSLAALLGASPGASVAVNAMIEVLERCFKQQMENSWGERLKKLIPSYGESLVNDAELLNTVRQRTLSTLNLTRD